MRFAVFQQEEFFERYQFNCRYMLALSGVQPLTMGELTAMLGDTGADVDLGYMPSAGYSYLRDRIAALYPGATREHVLVTVGATEALLIVVNLLVKPGDEAVCLWPSYQPLHGSVTAAGGNVRFVRLDPAAGFRIDLDAVRAAVTPRTRLVMLNSPHNPTGQDVPTAELVRLAEDLERRGIYLLVDEVFRRMWPGARDSAWVERANVVVVDGLSKSFGLPGLRIGWFVADPDLVVRGRQYRVFTSMNPGALDQALATAALHADERLLERTHRFVRGGLRQALDWFTEHEEFFNVVEPAGGGLLFPQLRLDVPSHAFCVQLVEQTGVLLAPGSDCYDMEGFVRFGFATADLAEGLDLFDRYLRRR
jgi:aspartate/methionine/tyrosine aminotransferase